MWSHGGVGLEDGDSVSHPNQYAGRSRVLAREAEEKAKAEGGALEGGPKVEVVLEESQTQSGGDAMVID